LSLYIGSLLGASIIHTILYYSVVFNNILYYSLLFSVLGACSEPLYCEPIRNLYNPYYSVLFNAILYYSLYWEPIRSLYIVSLYVGTQLGASIIHTILYSLQFNAILCYSLCWEPIRSIYNPYYSILFSTIL
jgi:hypothetical protein